MFSKKIALVAVVLLILGSIPALAAAAPPTPGQVLAGATQITGSSVDAMSLVAVFPNGVRSDTVQAAGQGALWLIRVPSSVKLAVGDEIRLEFTYGGSTGWTRIIVDTPGQGLGGSNGSGSVTSNGSSGNGSSATSAVTSSADNSTPQTGDAMPMLYLAVGLFVVGLAVAFLARELWLRHQN